MLIYLSLAIFLAAYGLIASEKFNRAAIVCAGAAAMVIIGATDGQAAFFSHETGIDWNVIFLLLGMMIIVSLIHKTGLFEFLAIKAIQLAKGEPKRAFAYILVLTAVASALLDNVTTILLVVPMTLLIAKHLKVAPIPFILGEVFISNIGGAATLIGDPPNIIIGLKANLSFNDFLLHMAPIAILATAVIIPYLLLVFRKGLVNQPESRATIMQLDARSHIVDSALLKKSLIVLVLVLLGFVLHSALHVEPAMVALLGAGLLVAISRLKAKEYVSGVEWETLVFFAGLFVMVGALVKVGAMAKFADAISAWVGNDTQLAAGALVLVSAVVSGIVDNIPYVTSMIPVVQQLNDSVAGITNDGLWWALALGADFGGNATIIGASANVVAIGIAYANGLKISFWTFAKYGIPVTLITTALALPYVLVRYF